MNKVPRNLCLFTSFAKGENDVKREDSADIFAAATIEYSKKRDYKSWYSQMRETLKKGTGPVNLGKSSPFPYNSEFIPIPPVADSIKDQLFRTWESDSAKWTVRQLSILYKVSMERVRAILKMKVLQKQMVKEGFRIHSIYVQRMEAILGAKSPVSAEVEHNEFRHNVVYNQPPKLVAIPKDGDLSTSEAAKLLAMKLKPIYSMIADKLEGDKVYQPITVKCGKKFDTKDLFIKHDPYEVSRWQFVITDTFSKCVYVRQRNGDLRKAHSSEHILGASANSGT